MNSLTKFSRLNRHQLFPLRKRNKYLQLFRVFLKSTDDRPNAGANEAARSLCKALVEALGPIEWGENLSNLFWSFDPDKSPFPIVRARSFPSRTTSDPDDQWALEARKALRNPKKLMSAPPPEATSDGRCHFASKPVFYGSFQEWTCMAEIRPLVGSRIIFASFIPICKLNIFRPSYLQEILNNQLSTYEEIRKMALSSNHYDITSFIYHLDLWLGHPLTSSYESSSYLARRILCNALRQAFQFDGLEFSSSQVSGDNIVIFPSDEKHKKFPLIYMSGSTDLYHVMEASFYAEKFNTKNIFP